VRNMNRSLALSFVLLATACAPRGEKLLERASESLSKGEYRAAMIDLKNYVGQHPDDARARAQLGLALLELGDNGGAESEIAKARELGADRTSIVVADCRLLVARDAYDRVLTECGDVGDPSIDAELAIVRGDALLGLQRFDEARANFQSAVETRPASLSAVQGLAAAAFALEGIAAARRVFEDAPPAFRDQPRYWLAQGSLEMRGGDFAAAERAFASAVEKTGKEVDSRDHLTSLAGLAEAQLRQGKSQEAAATSELLLEAAPKSPFAKMMRAQAAAGAGDLATARTLLEEAVSADPENAQARTMLGLVNLQQGNLGQAEMHLANVVARNPDNVRAQQLLASVRSQLQTPEQSLEALKPALGRPAADPALFALASQLSLQSGNREAALGYLDQAARSQSRSTPEGEIELASGYLAAGEIDRAVEILEAMSPGAGATEMQRDTLLVAALLRQGRTQEAVARADVLASRPADDTSSHGIAGAIYAAAGQRDKARTEWNRVLESRPGDAATRMNLARLDLAEGKPESAAEQLNKVLAADPKNLLATLGLAAVSESQQDAAGAERWVKKAVADHPESPEVRLAQAQFYLSRRDFGEARAAATEALRLSPKSASAANAMGLAELGAGDTPAAIARFKEAVELAPRGSYHMNLARAHLLDGKPDEALRVLDDALRVSARQPATLALAATIALQSGRDEKAAGYVARLRTLAPDAAGTMRLEGDLAMAGKRYKDALGFYEKAARGGWDGALAAAQYRAGLAAGIKQPQKPLEDWLSKAPGDAGVRVLLAEYEQQRGNDASAVAGYEKVLETAPGNVMALNNLAGIYQQKRDPRALSVAKRAYAAAPKSPAVQDTYGWALVESGELDKGLELIREAARGLPGVAEVQYHLGAALARKGETDEARRILQQVVGAKAPASVRTGAEAELAKLGR
jgi:putative PEP-CTERM system TPR-repeat lipoprotein